MWFRSGLFCLALNHDWYAQKKICSFASCIPADLFRSSSHLCKAARPRWNEILCRPLLPIAACCCRCRCPDISSQQGIMIPLVSFVSFTAAPSDLLWQRKFKHFCSWQGHCFLTQPGSCTCKHVVRVSSIFVKVDALLDDDQIYMGHASPSELFQLSLPLENNMLCVESSVPFVCKFINAIVIEEAKTATRPCIESFDAPALLAIKRVFPAFSPFESKTTGLEDSR